MLCTEEKYTKCRDERTWPDRSACVKLGGRVRLDPLCSSVMSSPLTFRRVPTRTTSAVSPSSSSLVSEYNNRPRAEQYKHAALSLASHHFCFFNSTPRPPLLQSPDVMLKLTIVATFALFLSSSPSLIYALPTSPTSSSSTIVGQVPTVANPEGLVDPHLFRRNLHQTFAKYQFAPVRRGGGGGGGNATSTVTANGTTTSPQSAIRRLQKKRGEEQGDLPTRIELGVITREPAIGLVRAGLFFALDG